VVLALVLALVVLVCGVCRPSTRRGTAASADATVIVHRSFDWMRGDSWPPAHLLNGTGQPAASSAAEPPWFAWLNLRCIFGRDGEVEDGDGARAATPPGPKGTQGQANALPREAFATTRSRTSVLNEHQLKAQKRDAYDKERRARDGRASDELERRERYLGLARSRVTLFKAEEIERIESMEAFKATKRQLGVDMRVELRGAFDKVQAAALRVRQDARTETLRVRKAKEAETAARKIAAKENAEKIAVEAQAERAQRRKDAQATVRKQAQQIREIAAHVRYETRPEVRKESRGFFQAQRDQLCEDERLRLEQARLERKREELSYVHHAALIASDTRIANEAMRESRRRLSERRQQEAAALRTQRALNEERKWRATESLEAAYRSRHDSVVIERFVSSRDSWGDEDDLENVSQLSSRSAGGRSLDGWKRSRRRACADETGGNGLPLSSRARLSTTSPCCGRHANCEKSKMKRPRCASRSPRVTSGGGAAQQLKPRSQLSMQVNLAQYL
jgi:hypothetical protein